MANAGASLFTAQQFKYLDTRFTKIEKRLDEMNEKLETFMNRDSQIFEERAQSVFTSILEGRNVRYEDMRLGKKTVFLHHQENRIAELTEFDGLYAVFTAELLKSQARSSLQARHQLQDRILDQMATQEIARMKAHGAVTPNRMAFAQSHFGGPSLEAMRNRRSRSQQVVPGTTFALRNNAVATPVIRALVTPTLIVVEAKRALSLTKIDRKLAQLTLLLRMCKSPQSDQERVAVAMPENKAIVDILQHKRGRLLLVIATQNDDDVMTRYITSINDGHISEQVMDNVIEARIKASGGTMLINMQINTAAQQMLSYLRQVQSVRNVAAKIRKWLVMFNALTGLADLDQVARVIKAYNDDMRAVLDQLPSDAPSDMIHNTVATLAKTTERSVPFDVSAWKDRVFLLRGNYCVPRSSWDAVL